MKKITLTILLTLAAVWVFEWQTSRHSLFVSSIHFLGSIVLDRQCCEWSVWVSDGFPHTLTLNCK